MIDRLSLRARLTIGFAGGLLAILAGAGAIVYERVGRDLNSTIDDALKARADDIAVIVRSAKGELPVLAAGPVTEVANEEGFFQVLDRRGKVVATTLQPQAGAALPPAQVRQAARGSVIVDRPVTGIEGQARVAGRLALSRAGEPFIVVAGASTDDRHEALAELTRTFLITGPPALLLAIGLGYLLAGRSLRPVNAMRRRAQEITLRRSGERLPLPHARDEIHQLGETLNTMLDRIEEGIRRERIFVADASHEFRTPLAILKTELELAGRPERSREDLAAALRSAREEVDRLAQLAEDLLIIARSEQGEVPIARERVDLPGLLERVRGRFEHRAGEANRILAVTAPAGAAASLDPFRIEQALANLVENALRHGAGDIQLTASQQDGTTTIEISDEGAGLPPGFAAQAFERFTRVDGGRSGRGAGLGLAIVRAIAESHRGTVKAMRSDDPPLTTFRLSLPSAG